MNNNYMKLSPCDYFGFEINTKLSLCDYLAMVNEIVLEFFNEDGVYQPHIGKINAMRLFYNDCVKKSPYDEKYDHDIVDIMDMIDIVADEGFIRAYNEALAADIYTSLDFGNAYRDAMEIVDVKKSSFGNAVETVGSMINRIVTTISSVLTGENIEKVSKIAKEISDGKINADAIVNAYVKHAKKQEDSESKVVAI